MHTLPNMEHFRPLAITNLSADDLEDIRLFGRMKVYAVGSIAGGPSTGHNEFTTSVDYEGETYPKWNTRIDFRLHDASLQNNRLYLNINFYCSRTLGDKHVGGVTVPVKRLFDAISGNRNPTPTQAVRFPVVTAASGEEQGFVKFSFAFGLPSPHSQSGLQQPFLQRPQPPQPRPSQSTQLHVVTGQQEGQLSGINANPYGSTTGPVDNQANDFSGTGQPQYYRTTDLSMSYQPNMAISSDQNSYYNTTGEYFNDNMAISSDQNSYYNTTGDDFNDLDEDYCF